MWLPSIAQPEPNACRIALHIDTQANWMPMRVHAHDIKFFVLQMSRMMVYFLADCEPICVKVRLIVEEMRPPAGLFHDNRHPKRGIERIHD